MINLLLFFVRRIALLGTGSQLCGLKFEDIVLLVCCCRNTVSRAKAIHVVFEILLRNNKKSLAYQI